MIQQPKVGNNVFINYRDKTMPYQDKRGVILIVGNGIKNCLIDFGGKKAVIPRGNLNFSERKVKKQLSL